MKLKIHLYCLTLVMLFANISYSQLIITSQNSPLPLIQKFIGQGILVSNVVVNANASSTGIFKNVSGTNLGLDSGVVLSSGRVKSSPGVIGIDGNGTTPAYVTTSATGALASSTFGVPGDNDLNTLIGGSTFDAAILEFDFVPFGDSIKFRYVFASEAYPNFACSGTKNDAVGCFIQGPGFPVNTNIAVVPGSNNIVNIDNVNNVSGCGLFPQFYVSNQNNVNFTYNGHTSVFTAVAKVQPCQSYHMKIVVADGSNDVYDSGIFLDAKSLNSFSTTITNVAQIDANGVSFLAEGCANGKIKVRRTQASPTPLIVNLSYGGTATNGIDVQTLPATITIPANMLEAEMNVVPLADALNEGNETLTVSLTINCGANSANYSTTIQIREYNNLPILPNNYPDTAFICRNATQQLTAAAGYTTYKWNPNSTLNNVDIANPFAQPTTAYVKYICNANTATCRARDSVQLRWKDISIISKADVLCASGIGGQIKIEAGSPLEWTRPLEFSIDNNPYQADSNFIGLTAGLHTIKIKDATGCIDSISTTLLLVGSTMTATITKTPSGCAPSSFGTFIVTPAGGNLPYTFAVDAGPFQTSNVLNATAGVHTISIKDVGGCVLQKIDSIQSANNLFITKPTTPNVCEGAGTALNILSNATTFEWTPIATLQNANTINPIASPTTNTRYYVKATSGNCVKIDSLDVVVLPAPIANAGADVSICKGRDSVLNGSGGVSFLWQPSTYLSANNVAMPTVVNALQTLEYYLTVKDVNGCASIKPDTVRYNVIKDLKIFAGNDLFVAVNAAFQLSVSEVSNFGITLYTWTNPYNLNFSNIYNPQGFLDRDFDYYVTGKTAANCEASDTIKVRILNGPEIYVPTAFSPNGDTKNDVLKPIYVGIKKFKYFKVFNRYAETVYSTISTTGGWNGIFKNEKQPIGTYVWVAEGEDDKGNIIQRKGSILLLR
jgi:gliding motility-associated-like protein